MSKSKKFLFSLLVLASAVAAQEGPPRRVGVMFMGTEASAAGVVAMLRDGLRESGWVEGRNLLLELRYAEGKPERIGEFAGQLAGLPVDVLVSIGTSPTLAARKAAPATPIVAMAADPAGNGLIARGGSIAAVDIVPARLQASQLQVLREMVPGLARLGVVVNGGNPVGQAMARRVTEAAGLDGIQVLTAQADGTGMLESAFAQLRNAGAQALLLIADPNWVPAAQVGQIVRANGLPTLCPDPLHVQAGCLVTYGVGLGATYKQAASYIDRILKGTLPGDLPIGTPERFELVIHGGAARSMDLKLPPALLQRANSVIE